MTTQAAPADLTGFLVCLQLADSAFPSGRYTLSHGLEAFVQAGLVTADTSPAQLLALLADQIGSGVAPADGVALVCAHRAAADAGPADLAAVGEADDRLTAVKLPRETRQSSLRVGRQLLNTAAAAFGSATVAEYGAAVRAGRHPGNAAVVVGLLTATLGVPVHHALAAELYAFAAGWLAAAVRLSVTDHRIAQWVLHHLAPDLAAAAAAASHTARSQGVAGIHSCTPLVDLMAMRHERTELRLFAS